MGIEGMCDGRPARVCRDPFIYLIEHTPKAARSPASYELKW